MASLKEIYEKSGVVMHPAAMKSGKLYSQVPHSGDGDFNFSRADGVQTRINEHGLIETVANNTPRLSYEIIDGEVVDCPHLLLEPSRTNLIENSEDFTGSGWTKNANTSLSLNSTTSPEGVNNASTLTTLTAFPSLYYTATTSASADYTFTFYVKNKNIDDITYRVYDASNAADIISPTSYYSQIGYEWTRISISFTTPSGCLSTRVYLCSDNSGIGEVFFWGAQLEEGDYETSYIPTSGATAQRHTEICGSAGNSSLFNSPQGVLFIDVESSKTTGSRISLSNSSTPFEDRMSIDFNTPSTLGFFTEANNDDTTFSFGIGTSSGRHKVALRWNGTDVDAFVDGSYANGSTFTGFSSGVLDRLQMTAANGTGTIFEGKVYKVCVFNGEFTDSELELLTS